MICMDNVLFNYSKSECECNNLVESRVHLPKMEEKKKTKWTTFFGRTEMAKLDNISRQKEYFLGTD